MGEGVLLLISTPKNTQEEKSNATDGEKSTKIIDPLQDFKLGETLRIRTWRRPVEEEEHAERAAVEDDVDPGTPSPGTRDGI
jgi:hypothetical protein